MQIIRQQIIYIRICMIKSFQVRQQTIPIHSYKPYIFRSSATCKNQGNQLKKQFCSQKKRKTEYNIVFHCQKTEEPIRKISLQNIKIRKLYQNLKNNKFSTIQKNPLKKQLRLQSLALRRKKLNQNFNHNYDHVSHQLFPVRLSQPLFMDQMKKDIRKNQIQQIRKRKSPLKTRPQLQFSSKISSIRKLLAFQIKKKAISQRVHTSQATTGFLDIDKSLINAWQQYQIKEDEVEF